MKKVVVIGLDGASWNLITPWIEEGYLPNIRYLLDKGSSGEQLSELPPVTSPNWKCYSTGKNPGKLGVFWWQRIDKEEHKLVSYDSASFKSAEYFDYIDGTVGSVGIFNMPTTYPPKKLSGFVVSGPPDGKEENFTYPVSLEDKLKQRFGYRIHPQVRMYDKRHSRASVRSILDLIDLKFKVAKELEKEVDFFHMSIFYINVLQHFFYNAEPTKMAWKIIDDNIKYFIERDYNLILISDHGIDRISAIFYVNKWLVQKGFLKIKPESHRERGVPSRLTSVPLDSVEWEESLAVATGQGSIYLTVNETHPNYASNRNLLIQELQLLRNPFSGNKVAKAVYRKEQIYKGPFLSIAPDIVFDQADDIYAVPSLHSRSVYSPPKKWDAENIRNGMFLAYGENVSRGNELRTTSILDIAPTILHWLGIPIPEDMDGRVILDVFSKGSEPRNRDIKYQKDIDVTRLDYSTGDDREIIARLRALGYLEQ